MAVKKKATLKKKAAAKVKTAKKAAPERRSEAAKKSWVTRRKNTKKMTAAKPKMFPKDIVGAIPIDNTSGINTIMKYLLDLSIIAYSDMLFYDLRIMN